MKENFENKVEYQPSAEDINLAQEVREELIKEFERIISSADQKDNIGKAVDYIKAVGDLREGKLVTTVSGLIVVDYVDHIFMETLHKREGLQANHYEPHDRYVWMIRQFFAEY